MIGAATSRAVEPWLLGPRWFRRLTVGAGSGAVVGSMLIHADGIDFRLLKPLWLAIGVFVTLPALFGVVMAVAVDRVSAMPAPQGPRRWVVPIILVAAFPVTIPLVLITAVVLVVWVPVRRGLESVGGLPTVAGHAVRGAWLTIAVLGLVALVGDVQALR